MCGGIKDENNNWNLSGHKNRIVEYNNEFIEILSSTFEDGNAHNCAKLVSMHNANILSILYKLSHYDNRVCDKSPIISECLHETGAPNAGIIERNTKYPTLENYEMIYNAPQFYVSHPCYKTPRSSCKNKGDFDTVDICGIEDEYIQRSNYIPLYNLQDYKSLFKGFVVGQNHDGSTKTDCWLDYYRVGFRKMINQAGERSLICAVLPRKTAHIHGVISATFSRGNDTVDMAALCASIVMDFYLKTIATQNLTPGRLQSFPLGVEKKYQTALYSRTLLLNCLTTAYADLWQEMWNVAYKNETWSKDDLRLKPFSMLHEDWAWDIPLRNYYERRQALVEIDVISAMALGLTLQDLEMIYSIQFPVLQQNENDTWYDAEGKIVFTCSKGLTGVGIDRKRNAKTGMLGWEDIRGEKIDENTYRGTMPTHTHTIDPAKSELYGGQQQTFVAPYTRCDRIADYRKAWVHFEKIFNR